MIIYLNPEFYDREIPLELALQGLTSTDDIKVFLENQGLDVHYVKHAPSFHPYLYQVKLEDDSKAITMFKLRYSEYLCQP